MINPRLNNLFYEQINSVIGLTMPASNKQKSLENILTNIAKLAEVRVFDIVNVQDEQGKSALQIAVEKDDKDAVNFFIKNGAKNYGEVISADPEISKILQRAKIIDARREYVLEMVQKNNERDLKTALDLTRNNDDEFDNLIYGLNRDGIALIDQITKENEIGKFFMEQIKHQEIEAVFSDSNFVIALQEGRSEEEVMQAFSEEMQPIIASGDEGIVLEVIQISLYYSLLNGRKEIAQHFFGLVTEIENEGVNGWVALLEAALMSDDPEIMEVCILEKLKRNHAETTPEEIAYLINSKYGPSAVVMLHEAAYNNKPKIAEYFLKNGADKEILDLDGINAAQMAANEGHEELAKLINDFSQTDQDPSKKITGNAIPLLSSTVSKDRN